VTSEASKKLRVSIIGAGHWGPNIIRNFHENPACHVAWVCDLDPVRLQLIKERYANIEVTSVAEQAVTDPTVEAVVVCSPTATHYALTKLATRP